MYAVGLMSGTSLDGVDAALVKINGSGLDTRIEMIGFNTYVIPDDIKKEIKMACSLEYSNVRLICSLNFKLGYFSNNFLYSIFKFSSKLSVGISYSKIFLKSKIPKNAIST